MSFKTNSKTYGVLKDKNIIVSEWSVFFLANLTMPSLNKMVCTGQCNAISDCKLALMNANSVCSFFNSSLSENLQATLIDSAGSVLFNVGQIPTVFLSSKVQAPLFNSTIVPSYTQQMQLFNLTGFNSSTQNLSLLYRASRDGFSY